MRAMLCRSLGSIDKLELGDVPPPPLTDGHVRIGVKAAGVNFPDILMVEGKYQVKPPFPFAPGAEVAGIVRAHSTGHGTQFQILLPLTRGIAAPGRGGSATGEAFPLAEQAMDACDADVVEAIDDVAHDAGRDCGFFGDWQVRCARARDQDRAGAVGDVAL